MPELQRVGLFRPVTEECAAAMIPVVNEACIEVGEYLTSIGNTSPVKPLTDFGLVIVRSEVMTDHLMVNSGQRCMLGSFIEDINQRVRPNEADQLSTSLANIDFPTGIKPRHMVINLAQKDPKTHQLMVDATLVAAIAGRRFKGLKFSLEKFSRLMMLDYGERDNRQVLPYDQRNYIRSIFVRRLGTAGLRRVKFGRLVIGPGPREPLPGTEWP